MVCLLMLIPIKKVTTTYHIIKFQYRREFTKPHIDVLVEKGMHLIYYGLLEF
jgi:hypothetical protein